MVDSGREAEGPSRFLERVRDVAPDMVSGTLGGVMGLLGPEGALAGGAVGPAVAGAIRWALAEYAGRTLSRREVVRVADALGHAAVAIERRLTAGEQPRSDGFFERSDDGRPSDAEELLEGVLVAAQREHEERKLPLLGELYASLAFVDSVDPAEAEYMLRVTQQLTYRQMCVLAVASVVVGDGIRPIRSIPGMVGVVEEHADEAELARRVPRLEGEMRQLAAMGLMQFEETGQIGLDGVEFFRRSHLGHDLVKLMDLEQRLPRSDLERVGRLCETAGRLTVGYQRGEWEWRRGRMTLATNPATRQP